MAPVKRKPAAPDDQGAAREPAADAAAADTAADQGNSNPQQPHKHRGRPKIGRSESIGSELARSSSHSRIANLDPTAGFSGWHALKSDVGIGLVCCAVMKLAPRLVKWPAVTESSIRRLLYVMLGSRVALLALVDVLRYQWRLITGQWQDDKTLHSCGLTVITTGKWFRIMMLSDLMM